MLEILQETPTTQELLILLQKQKLQMVLNIDEIDHLIKIVRRVYDLPEVSLTPQIKSSTDQSGTDGLN
jgi:hypothetical protein